MLAKTLRESGWDSTSYDPMGDTPPPDHPFDLVTVFEVFEHVPDPHEMMRELVRLVRNVVIFTTALNDDEADPVNWWYLAPRNGHVVLYSKLSLGSLLRHHGLQLVSVDPGVHLGFRHIPQRFEVAVS